MSTLIDESDSLSDDMESDRSIRDFGSRLNLNTPQQNGINKRRKFCVFGSKCRRTHCDFAHTKGELNTTPVFNRVCPNLQRCEHGPACFYIHPNDPEQKPFGVDSPKRSTSETRNSNNSNLQRLQNYVQQTASAKNLSEPPTSDFDIPTAVSALVDGGSFVVYDSRSDQSADLTPNRVIIFGSSKGLEELRAAQSWAFNSTNRHVPKHFSEMTSVFALVDEDVEKQVRPSVAIISTRRINSDFKLVLDKLVDAIGSARPASLFLDYDRSVIAECGRKFRGRLKMFGCFFHFVRHVYEEIEKNDDAFTRLLIDSRFQLQCKRLALLAFVPVDKLREAFDLICAQVREEYGSILDSIFEHILKTFIGNGSVPEIAPAFWNTSTRSLDDLQRCSNSLAAWEQQFGQQIEVNKPGIWPWIRTLQTLIATTAPHAVSQSANSPAGRMFETLKMPVKIEKKKLIENKIELPAFFDALSTNFEFTA